MDALLAVPSWSVPYDDGPDLFPALRSRIQEWPGFVLVSGVPVDGIRPEEAGEYAASLLRPLGNPLLQGPRESRSVGWLVRNEGSSRFLPDGSYRAGVYTSKSSDLLDIHNDGAMRPYGHEVDLFALLCLGAAAEGGESVLVSSLAVIDVLRREFPAELERLSRPFAFERGHVAEPGEPSIEWAPIFAFLDGRLRIRWNRQRIEMASATTGIPLTVEDVAALDALDAVLRMTALQLRLRLSPGDLLIVDDHLVLHGREAFTDGPSGGGRCLVRVLLSRR